MKEEMRLEFKDTILKDLQEFLRESEITMRFVDSELSIINPFLIHDESKIYVSISRTYIFVRNTALFPAVKIPLANPEYRGRVFEAISYLL